MNKILADLEVQAVMFDMEVDWETLTLVPKKKKIEAPVWIRRWRENRENADFDEYIDIDRE